MARKKSDEVAVESEMLVQEEKREPAVEAQSAPIAQKRRKIIDLGG